MKIARQLVSFLLGLAVGVCLYSLFKLRPLFQTCTLDRSPEAGENHPGKSLRSFLLRKPLVERFGATVPADSKKPAPGQISHSAAVKKGVTVESHPVLPPALVASKPSRGVEKSLRPSVPSHVVVTAGVSSAPILATILKANASGEESSGQSIATKEVAAVNVAPAPSAPTIFKTIGYVEKASGQVEAIILQENELQVVHQGELISGRYRVTKISADSVSAVDETLVQTTMAKLHGADSNELTATLDPSPSAMRAQSAPPAHVTVADAAPRLQDTESDESSLGYVQKADGRLEAVVADGDSVRLVPATSAVTMAKATAPPSIRAQEASVQVSTLPASVETKASGAPMANPPIHSERVPDASVIRQASYQVVTAEGSAPSPSISGSTGEGALATSSEIEPAGAALTKATMNSAASADCLVKPVVEMKSIGYVESANGEVAAILSSGDNVFVVHPGDRFAGHYRAVSVPAEVVEAVEEPPRNSAPLPYASPPVFPTLLSALAEPSPPFPSKRGTPPEANTLIFQTLGYVEMQDGTQQAVVADGSSLYLVKQGEIFADQYRATSVDPGIVLAVRVSPRDLLGNSLTARAKPSGRIASKNLYGYLHSSLSGLASPQFSFEVDASGSPDLVDLGAGLLNSSLTGFDLQAHFLSADNSNFKF
ncbi:MAG: hypothetical protein P4N24_08060 [Acidobacteriota bacterium]|nr:hypothetical protein [Acidobacteriota bacterium]